MTKTSRWVLVMAPIWYMWLKLLCHFARTMAKNHTIWKCWAHLTKKKKKEKIVKQEMQLIWWNNNNVWLYDRAFASVVAQAPKIQIWVHLGLEGLRFSPSDWPSWMKPVAFVFWPVKGIFGRSRRVMTKRKITCRISLNKKQNTDDAVSYILDLMDQNLLLNITVL